MYYPTPYIYKAAAEDASEGVPFSEALKSYNDRMLQYGKDVTTDSKGTKKRRYLQSLGMVTSALLGAAGGAAVGAILGGSKGSRIGVPLGLAAGIGANYVGLARGFMAPVRNESEQRAYNDSNEGILKELLVPGVAGYQRGRTWRHIQDTVNKEYADKRVV